MIDFDTIRFLKMLDDLTKLSENEIIPFSKMTNELRESNICYDEENRNLNGTYKIPLDMCLVCDHHDIIDYYGNIVESANFTIGVRIDEYDGRKFIDIDFAGEEHGIVVENGRWYIS